MLDKDLKDNLVSLPCHGQGHLPRDRLLQTPYNLDLNTSGQVLDASVDGASTTSLLTSGKRCKQYSATPGLCELG